MDEKVAQAINNVIIIVSNTKMTAQEHEQLRQDIILIRQQCELAATIKPEKTE